MGTGKAGCLTEKGRLSLVRDLLPLVRRRSDPRPGGTRDALPLRCRGHPAVRHSRPRLLAPWITAFGAPRATATQGVILQQPQYEQGGTSDVPAGGGPGRSQAGCRRGPVPAAIRSRSRGFATRESIDGVLRASPLQAWARRARRIRTAWLGLARGRGPCIRDYIPPVRGDEAGA